MLGQLGQARNEDKSVDICASGYHHPLHNRLWQDPTFMVKNMSSDFTAFADARGLLIGPRLMLPASFTPYRGLDPAPTAHGTIVSVLRDSECDEED